MWARSSIGARIGRAIGAGLDLCLLGLSAAVEYYALTGYWQEARFHRG
jgi:hypothetical protein